MACAAAFGRLLVAIVGQPAVADVRERLKAGYTLVSETPSGFQVWRRTDLAER